MGFCFDCLVISFFFVVDFEILKLSKKKKRMRNDFEECNIDDEHIRTIIHIDIDCFYAQVEMNKNPSLRTKPLGIQQKNIIVTCNYVAREKNIRKVMPVSEALKTCPDLVLVNGEDLQEYRKVSNHLNDLIRNKYTALIEKIGFDECFIDVSDIVNTSIAQNNSNDVVGCVFGENFEKCECGCDARLKVGSKIAQEIRDRLFVDLKLTSSAGISYNKLLAKLAAGYRKPNNQTVLFASNVKQFMLDLPLRKIPGIGEKVYEILAKNKIESVKDLQSSDLNFLKVILKNELAIKLFDYSFGKDNSLKTLQPLCSCISFLCTPLKKIVNFKVKIQEKPQSIGLEESFSAISELDKVKEKFNNFLNRLIDLINEDGRVPGCLKVTVRTIDAKTKAMKREQRQRDVVAVQIFELKDNEIIFKTGGHRKCLWFAIDLFLKVLDNKRTFRVNLLGLSFKKFENVNCLQNNLMRKFVRNQSSANKTKTIINIDICNDSDNENDQASDTDSDTEDIDPDDGVECIRILKRLPVPEVERSRKKQKKSNTILNYFAKK